MSLTQTASTMVYKTPTYRYFNLFKSILMAQFEKLDTVENKATHNFDIDMLFRVKACRTIKHKINTALQNLTHLFNDDDPDLRSVTRKLGLIHKQVRLVIGRIKKGVIKPTSAQLTNIKAFLIIYDKFKLLKQVLVPMHDPDYTFGY